MVESQRKAFEEQIGKSGAWAYFDVDCQGDPPICGAGGVIHLDDHHIISFKVGLSRGTINKAKLMALKLPLILSAEKGAQKLQIFGDSLVVVKWKNWTNSLENFNLQPICEGIQLARRALNSLLSFHHVYRERNVVADGLLKAGLLMEGAWII